MKKIFSLLLCVAMVLSFSTVAFAGTPNFNATVTPAEIKVGETVTAVLSMNECRLGTVGASIVFDKDVFECTSIVADEDSDNQLAGYIVDEDAEVSTTTTANTYGSVGVGKTRNERNYAAGNVITVTFVAKKASDGAVFKLTEDSDGTNEYRDAEGRVVATVVVKSAEPEKDETIAQGTKGDAAGNKVTWTGCSVGADLVAANKIKAVLTNSAAAAGDNTQEVALSFGEGISGGMACVFDVIVTFQDISNAETTSLNIVQAN